MSGTEMVLVPCSVLTSATQNAFTFLTHSWVSKSSAHFSYSSDTDHSEAWVALIRGWIGAVLALGIAISPTDISTTRPIHIYYG